MQSQITPIGLLILDQCNLAHFVILKFVHKIFDNKLWVVKGCSLQYVPVLVHPDLNELAVGVVANGEEPEVVIFDGLKEQLVLRVQAWSHWIRSIPAVINHCLLLYDLKIILFVYLILLV